MNATIKNVLEKPMDRKDFLKHVGVGALIVAGGGLIANALKLQYQGPAASQLASQTVSTASTGLQAYSASVYGR